MSQASGAGSRDDRGPDRLIRVVRGVRRTDLLALLIVLGAWSGLARALMGGPFLAAGLDIALIVLTLDAVRRRTPLRREQGGVALAIVAYMGLAAVEILNPNVPSLRAGLEGFRKTAFTMLAFFVVLWNRDGDGRRFFAIVGVGTVPALLMAIRQSFGVLPVEMDIISSSGISPITFHSDTVLRAFSPTAGPFHLGALSALVAVIAIVFARSQLGRSMGWRWIALSLLACITLGLTLTRADMAALVAAVIAVAVVSGGWSERGRTILLATPGLAAMAVTVLLAIGVIGLSFPTTPAPGSTPTPTNAPGSKPSVTEVIKGVLDPLQDKNMQFRFGYWKRYLAAVEERPIVGYGTSAAADGFDHFYKGTGSVNFEPHSLYFKAALELGVIGLGLLLAIFAAIAWAVRSTLRRDPTLGMIGLGALAVVAISGVTGPMLDAYPVNVLFWAMCGWMLTIGRPDLPDSQAST